MTKHRTFYAGENKVMNTNVNLNAMIDIKHEIKQNTTLTDIS
jgi:hypothetical protein